jgi:hypothetical protein
MLHITFLIFYLLSITVYATNTPFEHDIITFYTIPAFAPEWNAQTKTGDTWACLVSAKDGDEVKSLLVAGGVGYSIVHKLSNSESVYCLPLKEWKMDTALQLCPTNPIAGIIFPVYSSMETMDGWVKWMFVPFRKGWSKQEQCKGIVEDTVSGWNNYVYCSYKRTAEDQPCLYFVPQSIDTPGDPNFIKNAQGSYGCVKKDEVKGISLNNKVYDGHMKAYSFQGFMSRATVAQSDGKVTDLFSALSWLLELNGLKDTIKP